MVLFLVALVVAARPVVAAEDVPEEQLHFTGAEGLEMDAEDYADQLGVTTEEALRRLKLQTALHQEIDELAQLAPDRFAGGWIEHKPEFRAVLSFTGDAQALADVISRAPGNVHVRTGAAFTLNQLNEAVERLDAIMSEKYPQLGFGADVRLGSIELSGPTKLSKEDLDELEQLAGVPIILEEVPARTQMHTYGGKLLTEGIFNECTTGFTVQHTQTLERGVLTAAHCANALRYHQAFLSWYDLTWRGQFNDASHDAQWMDNNVHIHYDDYWNGFGLIDVTGQVTRANAIGGRMLRCRIHVT